MCDHKRNRYIDILDYNENGKTTTKRVDINLFLNTLNAEAGRFKYSDKHLRDVLLKAQQIIATMADNSKCVVEDNYV